MCERVANLFPMECRKWHVPLPGLDLERMDPSYSLFPLLPAGTWMRWASLDHSDENHIPGDGTAITC